MGGELWWRSMSLCDTPRHHDRRAGAGVGQHALSDAWYLEYA